LLLLVVELMVALLVALLVELLVELLQLVLSLATSCRIALRTWSWDLGPENIEEIGVGVVRKKKVCKSQRNERIMKRKRVPLTYPGSPKSLVVTCSA
jgi:hypothetical protein